MSLLMEALKQAEHAKHGARPETLPPATAPAAVDDLPAPLTELSLAPVETGAPDMHVAHDIPPAPAFAEPLDAVSATPAEATPDTIPDTVLAAPPRESVAPPLAVDSSAPGTGQPHDSPASAARILTASAAQQAMQRRRTLVGAIGLAGTVAVAVGSYYYYASLTQQNPYLGLPQPPALAETTVADAAVAVAPAVATAGVDSALDSAAESVASPAMDATPPAQTPWQVGPPPAESEITQDWEPAPVDVRALRGEHPVPPMADTDTDFDTAPDSAPPVAAISITRSTQPDPVSLDLQTAYNDFHAGRTPQAEQAYRQVLARDATNRDAHLGLAAVAVRNAQLDTAREHYRAVLQRNPKDLTAQAALTDLDQARPAASESQLKLLLTEQPQSAPLHFALANLYAEQQRWPYAQQAYFEAQRLAPEQPDYAFNLAVSLEHLGQPRLALEYYRRALQLAAAHNAQFDPRTAQQRVEVLRGTLQAPP